MNLRYLQLPDEIKEKIKEEEYDRFSVKFQYAILKEFSIKNEEMEHYDKLRVDVRKHISEDLYQLLPLTIQWQLSSNRYLHDSQIRAISKLPWDKYKTEKPQISVPDAKKLLDQTHLGLDSIKNRVLRYIACQKRIGSSYGHVLLFCGPPGVGKTSIAHSIAKAMGRELVKISLAGVTEGAVLKGTSTIYSNARPGRIIDALISSKSFSPVIVLDEIDKLTATSHGANPQYALLDILDSDRSQYIDECLGIPLDLRNVIFIATANNAENISPILLDRLDTIQLPGYTKEEKLGIARDYLLRDMYQYYQLDHTQIHLEDEVIQYIIDEFSNEAGVRRLNHTLRQIFEEVVYCREMGMDCKENWSILDINEFFDI